MIEPWALCPLDNLLNSDMTKKIIYLRDYVLDDYIFEIVRAEKTEILREIADRALGLSIVSDEEAASELFHQLLKREQLGSTGIIPGIAIPHCKTDLIHTEMAILIGFSRSGVNFESHDGNPVHLLFTVLTRKNLSTLHLGALASISRMISKHGLASNVQKFLDLETLRNLITECEYEI